LALEIRRLMKSKEMKNIVKVVSGQGSERIGKQTI
jgi:hypothetical protein